jgi:hypothetical protein
MLTIEQIEVLLLVAAVVAMLARRLRVPYSIGLVIAGIGLALLPFTPRVELTKGLIFTAFLPPLIFEAAIHLRWRNLRKDLPVILVLATLGVLLAAVVTGAGMHYIVRWSWPAAMIFGVLIAATDPVSIIATFKEIRVEGRVRLLVEAESLFNDCTAAVAYAIVLAFAGGRSVGATGVMKTLDPFASGCDRRSPGRSHFYARRRLWLVPPGGALSSLGSFGNIGSRLDCRECWTLVHLFADENSRRRVLGVRGVLRQLADFPAYRNTCGASEFSSVSNFGARRDRTRDPGTSGCDLSLLPRLLQIEIQSYLRTSAHPFLGWVARRARPGAGAGVAA